MNTTTYQGYSWYHSLQVRAARRMSRSLSLNGSFTWSKNMLANGFLNPATAVPYETLSGADRPFRVNGRNGLPRKADANARKHGVTFDLASTVFHGIRLVSARKSTQAKSRQYQEGL